MAFSLRGESWWIFLYNLFDYFDDCAVIKNLKLLFK